MLIYKAYFNRRLLEAREAVPEPPQPKVKLRLTAKTPEPPPKIMLRIGSKATTDNTNGVAVDNEALKRQQDYVKAGANGHIASANGDLSTNPTTNIDTSTASRRITTNQLSNDNINAAIDIAQVTLNGVKSETQLRQSSAIPSTVVRHNSNTSTDTPQSPHAASISMPPPTSITPRLPSGSPHPQVNHSSVNNQISNPLDSRWRQPGRGEDLFYVVAFLMNLHKQMLLMLLSPTYP